MSIDTRSNILQVARALFIKQGFTATSMREISEAAGIGKATIYHHFPDKNALAQALIQENAAVMGTVMEKVRAETNPRKRIETATLASIEFLYGFADLLQIIRREVPGARDSMQSGFTVYFKSYRELLTEVIQIGVDQGLFASANPEESARVLMTMIQGTFATAYLANEKAPSPQQAADSLLKIYFRGLDSR